MLSHETSTQTYPDLQMENFTYKNDLGACVSLGIALLPDKIREEGYGGGKVLD